MVLDSLLYQTSFAFELIIADDGSGEETSKLIKDYQKIAPFDVQHVWHEDKGWRKAEIHNIAISKAKNEHIILFDGDCILGPKFVQDHQKIYLKENENFILMGRRIELGEQITKELNKDNYRSYLLTKFPKKLIKSALKKDTYGALRKFSIHSPILRTLIRANNVKDLLGANFSTTKTKLLEINGFDEYTDQVGGSEDGDLFVRIRNTKTKLIGKKYFAPMFHLWHKRGERIESRQLYLERLEWTDYFWTPNGIIKQPKKPESPSTIDHQLS